MTGPKLALNMTAFPGASTEATVTAVVDTLTAPEFSSGLLRELVPELKTGQWKLMTCEVTHAQKHGRKHIVFCRISYRASMRGWPKLVDLVIKVDTKDTEYGATAIRAIDQLWNVGFCAPARCRVPRPYGYSAVRGTLVQASAPGLTWIDFLTSDPAALSTASARAADWLLQLQSCAAQAPSTNGQQLITRIEKWHRELAEAFPRAEPQLGRVCDTLLARLGADIPATVPSHGDYHLKNIFFTSRITTVIDFDTFGLREPAYDVGYGIGQALSMSYFRLNSWAPGARAALAFWRRYQRTGQASWSRVAAHAASTLLKNLHYALCPMQTKRFAMLDQWPALMEALLTHDRPMPLEGLGEPLAWLPASPAGTDSRRIEIPQRQVAGELQVALS